MHSASGRLVRNSICTNQSLATEACNILDVTIPCLTISTLPSPPPPPEVPRCQLTWNNRLERTWDNEGSGSEPINNDADDPAGTNVKTGA